MGYIDQNSNFSTKKKIFTRNYGRLIDDFFAHGHDLLHNVTWLPVHLFTLPKNAHYLIGRHEVLVVLMRCFLGEIEYWKDSGIIANTFHETCLGY